jgi:hypothetical protein
MQGRSKQVLANWTRDLELDPESTDSLHMDLVSDICISSRPHSELPVPELTRSAVFPSLLTSKGESQTKSGDEV